MTFRRGFTLIEILVATMLTGLLSALVIAPVAGVVRRVVDDRREYTDMTALNVALDFIGRDIFSAMRLSPTALRVVDNDALGGRADDVLMVMSSSPSAQGMSGGAVVYKVFGGGGVMRGSVLPGLYRWVMPGIELDDIDHEKLDPSEGQLVLPYADEFSVEIPTNSRRDDNRKEYSGGLPEGVYIIIGRGEINAETYITFP